jgi:hypothetical protein
LEPDKGGNEMMISINNKKLAHTKSLALIQFLQGRYPTPNVNITFLPTPVWSVAVENTAMPLTIHGICQGTVIHVSGSPVLTEVEQLRAVGHEYRHAMQTNEGVYPDSEAKFGDIVGQQYKFHAEAERDAVEFSDRVVAEFLYAGGSRLYSSLDQRSAVGNEESLRGAPKSW